MYGDDLISIKWMECPNSYEQQVLGPDHNTTTKDVELYLKESLQGFQTLAQMAVE